jgi:hypothetical protein
MKNVFYYFFGIITALYAFVILFNLSAPVYLDDYYMDMLTQNYAQEWYYTNLAVSAVTIFFVLVWVYNMGRGTNHEKKEPLLINKEEENE